MAVCKIATWNVNSLRVRLPQVLAWLEKTKPDVLALQEIKMLDADFPFALIAEAGYEAVVSGQKTYNGVATLINKKISYEKTSIVKSIPNFADPQKRILGVTIQNLHVFNLYVPNGEHIHSDKYQYKLNWLKQFDLYLRNELAHSINVILMGDFNIAPQEIDVYDPKRWEGQVLFSDRERNMFYQLLQAGFNDCFRQLNPLTQEFSWWDYRLNAFNRNMGLRIDHILAKEALASQCKKCYIDKNPRAQERPSDHAPVLAEFALA